MRTIYFQGTSNQVRAAIHLAVQLAAGVSTSKAGARDYSVAISTLAGNALLANVKTNFEKKSKGGVGIDGEKWTPLLPATIYAKLAKNKAAMVGKGAVKQARRDRLKEYKKRIAAARAKIRAGVMVPAKDIPADLRLGLMKSRRRMIERQAAILVGWFPHEVFGSPGKGVYPFALTLILRDVGILYASLSAGYQATRYKGPSADQQVFKAEPGEVIVGTKVPYAGAHQWGAPKAGVPRRQILPEPGQMPGDWWDDIVDAVAGGLQSLIQILLGGTGNP